MPKQKQKVYDVTSAHAGQHFSRRDLLDWIDNAHPGTLHGSILPSDYLYQDAVKNDPSNDGNRHQHKTYPRFLERVGRDEYRFGGWDGMPSGAIVAPATRGATTP
jgi:hypothetical protein